MEHLPLNTRDLVPVEVPHEPEPVVYHLRVPTILDRQRWRRDVAALGARYPSESELYEAMRTDVQDLIAEPDVARLLALIDACEANQDRISDALAHLAAGDEGPRDVMTEILGEDGARTFSALEEELRRRGAAYARLVADRAYYVEVATTLAVAHFLAGVDGLDMRLDHRGGRLCDEVLDRLPPHHIGIVGARALALMRPDGRARKNSESSPNTSGIRASSPAAASRRKAHAAGGSAGNAMRETPSSRSTTSGGKS